MSVVVTGYESAVRVGVLCRPENSGAARWPFAHFTFGAIGCSVTVHRPASRQRPHTFAWTDVTKAERIRSGVRLRFDDPARNVAIRAIPASDQVRLLDAVRAYCPAGTLDEEVCEAPPARWSPTRWLPWVNRDAEAEDSSH